MAMTTDDLVLRAEVQDILVRFCRGIDRLDVDLVKSCFHDDAVDDHGMFKGSGHAFAEYAMKSGASMTATSHQITNATVRRDGDVVHSEAYVHVVLRMGRPDGELRDHTILARYIDRFERRDGELRIAERAVVYDLTRIDSVGDTWGLGDDYTGGRRDTGDLSYRTLSGG